MKTNNPGESENQVAQFCDWEGETCKGETVNDYQHMLVMKNVNEYGSFNVSIFNFITDIILYSRYDR